MLEHAEVQNNNDGDEGPEEEDEFALGDEISFAGLVNKFGDFAHGAMHREILEAHIDNHAEAESENAEQNADHQQSMAVDGAIKKADLGKVRKFQRGFAAGFRRGLSEGRGSADGKQRGHGKSFFQESRVQETRYHTASLGRSSGEPGAHNESSK